MADRKIPKRKQNIYVVLAVLGVVGVLAGFSRLPSPPPGEVSRLAGHFKFDWQNLPPVPMPPGGVVFPIIQKAKHFGYYLTMIGASAALGDLDGDGLPNDLCITDVRAKSITVGPVPGTGNRYPTFSLDFGPGFDRRTAHPSVCRIADMNEDGLADIFVAFWGRPPVLLLRRAPGDLKPGAPLSMDSFKVQELIADPTERWWTATATFADIDGDGHQDLVIGDYAADGSQIFVNDNSPGKLEMPEDFTRARNGGLSKIFLFAGSQSGAEPSVVYKEAHDVFPGDGARAWTLAVGAADLDRDGLSDLYIANDFGPDEMLWNHSTPGHVNLQLLKGEKGFLTPESMVVGRDSFKGMSSDFGDINNDGIFDMFISNISSPFGMSESHFLWVSTGKADQMAKMAKGIAPWVDRADQMGVSHSSWGWDTRFEDFDNDGVLELVQATGFVKGTFDRWKDLGQLGTSNDLLIKYPQIWPKFDKGTEVDGHYPSPFYAMGNEGRYINIATSVLPGFTPAARGIAVADVDGDGYPEMVFSNIWEDSTYIKNNSSGNRFLGVHFLLPLAGAGNEMKIHDGHPAWREGTPAIGTFVEADVPDGLKQIRQVDGGNGHSGQRSPEIRFGLGHTTASEIPLKVTWRDFQGALHHDEMALAPGYHTVVLGSKVQGGK